MPMVYNGEMPELTRDAERLCLEYAIHQSKIASLEAIMNAQYEQAIMEADYRVLTEGGTFDDLEALYMEAEEGQKPKEMGIIRTIISTIGKKLQEFGDWILKALGQNGERLQKDVPEDAQVEEDNFVVALAETVASKAEGFFSFAKESLAKVKGALEGTVDSNDVMKITGTISAAAFGLGALIAGSKEERELRKANGGTRQVTKKNVFEWIQQFKKIEDDATEVKNQAEGILGLLQQGKGTVSAVYNQNMEKHMAAKQERAQKRTDKKAEKERAAAANAPAQPAQQPTNESASMYGLESYDSLFMEAGKQRSFSSYINALHKAIQAGDKAAAQKIYNSAVNAAKAQNVGEKGQNALASAQKALNRMPDTPKQKQPAKQANPQPQQTQNAQPAQQPTQNAQPQQTPPAQPANNPQQPQQKPAAKPKAAPKQNAQPQQPQQSSGSSGSILSDGNASNDDYQTGGSEPAKSQPKQGKADASGTPQEGAQKKGANADPENSIPMQNYGEDTPMPKEKKPTKVQGNAKQMSKALQGSEIDQKTGLTKEDQKRIKECEAALNNEANVKEYQDLQKAGTLPTDKKGQPLSYENWVANTKISYSKTPGGKPSKELLNSVANANKRNGKYVIGTAEMQLDHKGVLGRNEKALQKAVDNSTTDGGSFDDAQPTMRVQVDTKWYDQAIVIVKSILDIVVLMIPASFKCLSSSAADMCSWLHKKAGQAKDAITGKLGKGNNGGEEGAQPAEGTEGQEGQPAQPAPDQNGQPAQQPTGESVEEPDLFGIHEEFMEYADTPSEEDLNMFSAIIDNL